MIPKIDLFPQLKMGTNDMHFRNIFYYEMKARCTSKRRSLGNMDVFNSFIHGLLLRRWRQSIHGWRRVLSVVEDSATADIDTPMDDGDSSQTTETGPRTVDTFHGWRRLLSDDEDSSTDGLYPPWKAEAAIPQTIPQTVEILHRWRRLIHG